MNKSSKLRFGRYVAAAAWGATVVAGTFVGLQACTTKVTYYDAPDAAPTTTTRPTTPTSTPTTTPTPTTTATIPPAPSCYAAVSAQPVSGFGSAVQPSPAPTDCTLAQVDAFKAGCLGSGASSQTCDPITNDGRNTTCLDCLIEGRAGAKVTALLVSTDGMTVIPNVASCQAIADGHPECAVEVVRSASCHLRQCGKCNDNQLQECETFADNPSYGNCRTVPVTAACKKYMTVNVSGPCGGTTFDERYLAAAKALCAGGPTDGGTD